MEVEGAMSDDSVNCQNAVIRVDADQGVGAGPNVQEICGTVESVIQPIVSNNNTVRIRFCQVFYASVYSQIRNVLALSDLFLSTLSDLFLFILLSSNIHH